MICIAYRSEIYLLKIIMTKRNKKDEEKQITLKRDIYRRKGIRSGQLKKVKQRGVVITNITLIIQTRQIKNQREKDFKIKQRKISNRKWISGPSRYIAEVCIRPHVSVWIRIINDISVRAGTSKQIVCQVKTFNPEYSVRCEVRQGGR